MLDLQTQLYILSATFGAVIFLLIILVLVLALSVARWVLVSFKNPLAASGLVKLTRWVHIISTNIVIFRLIILPVNQTTIFSNFGSFSQSFTSTKLSPQSTAIIPSFLSRVVFLVLHWFTNAQCAVWAVCFPSNRTS